MGWLRKTKQSLGHIGLLRELSNLAKHWQVLIGDFEGRRDFDSPLSVFQAALDNERKVTEAINSLYALAQQSNDYPSVVLLQWFITEQVEEEKTAREIVHKFHLLKDDPASLLDLDRDLGNRTTAALPKS